MPKAPFVVVVCGFKFEKTLLELVDCWFDCPKRLDVRVEFEALELAKIFNGAGVGLKLIDELAGCCWWAEVCPNENIPLAGLSVVVVVVEPKLIPVDTGWACEDG